MKKYNIKNYIRYKEDVLRSQPKYTSWQQYTRNELIIKFLPLVENIARKFSTSQQASGVMSIMDVMQAGNTALTLAVDKIDWVLLMQSEDIERSLKSFLAKRIRGHIRRSIDTNRGDMRIPEHKINEIRKDNGENKKLVEMFFNSIFLSIDKVSAHTEESFINQIPDKSEVYNAEILNLYLMGILKKHLNIPQYEVLRLSYGLDCTKHSAKEIAVKLNIQGVSAYVRVSELKKQAVNILIENVEHSQVLDYL